MRNTDKLYGAKVALAVQMGFGGVEEHLCSTEDSSVQEKIEKRLEDTRDESGDRPEGLIEL